MPRRKPMSESRSARDHAGPADVRIVVVFDTAGFLRNLPLTGAASRALRLNRHLAELGCQVTLLLCDLNPASTVTDDWPLDVRYLGYETVYGPSAALGHLVASLSPDVLVMSNTQLIVRYGRAIAETAGSTLVYEMHDDEGALLRSIGSPAADYQAATVLQAAAIGVADATVAFTSRDAATARALRPDTVHIVPGGVDISDAGRRAPQVKGQCAFLGNLHYEPNARALRFLSGIAGGLGESGAHVQVYGRYPQAMRRLRVPGLVELRGPVPDLQAALSTAQIGIAPLDSGGGMKCKVLDYMAAGLAVVATLEALVGFTDPHAFSLISAHPQMADVPALIRRLLADPALRARLGEAGRRIAARHYSWPAIAVRAATAYAVISGRPEDEVPAAPGAAALELAAAPPYWLSEWRTQEDASDSREHPPMPDFAKGAAGGVVGSLAASIDCARLTAETALGTRFDRDALVGYGGRSLVFLGTGAVLKVYTHRWSDRSAREVAGLRLAVTAPGLRIPRVLGHDDVPGALAWVACTRLAGTGADHEQPPAEATTGLLGAVAARLHAVPRAALGELPEFGRRIRDLAGGDTDARLEGDRLTAALAGAEAGHRAECVPGFVHGDYSGRNVLLTAGADPAVIDFEGCGRGCVYEDLANLVVQDGLLGGRGEQQLIAAYARERSALGTGIELNRTHLYFHIARYLRWVLQWAVEIDQPLAARVTALAPAVLQILADGTTW